MTNRTGRNTNTNTEATLSQPISVGSAAAVKIADINAERLFIHINTGPNNNGCWIKLQGATVDNDKKGIFLDEKNGVSVSWEMPPDNIYTGEISAIAESGNVDIYVTEY